MTLLNFNFTKSQFDFSGRFSIYSLYAKNLQKTTYGLVNFNVCGGCIWRRVVTAK